MLFKYLQFGFRGKVSWNESDLKIKSHHLGGNSRPHLKSTGCRQLNTTKLGVFRSSSDRFTYSFVCFVFLIKDLLEPRLVLNLLCCLLQPWVPDPSTPAFRLWKLQVPLFSSTFPKLNICSGDGTNTGLLRVNKLTIDKEVPKGV